MLVAIGMWLVIIMLVGIILNVSLWFWDTEAKPAIIDAVDDTKALYNWFKSKLLGVFK